MRILADQRKESAVALAGHHHRARDDRQRLLLPVKGLPCSLQASRSSADGGRRDTGLGRRVHVPFAFALLKGIAAKNLGGPATRIEYTKGLIAGDNEAKHPRPGA